ncbi:hypothetical protein C8R44DRAFT_796303 [Mycena epipterygia]|nr:hypothetical protein C8R44DRAFT_796303 [Mycena epipterygia]
MKSPLVLKTTPPPFTAAALVLSVLIFFLRVVADLELPSVMDFRAFLRFVTPTPSRFPSWSVLRARVIRVLVKKTRLDMECDRSSGLNQRSHTVLLPRPAAIDCLQKRR